MPGTNAGGPARRVSHPSDGASHAHSSRSKSTNPRLSPRKPSTRRSHRPSVTSSHRCPSVSAALVACRDSAWARPYGTTTRATGLAREATRPKTSESPSETGAGHGEGHPSHRMSGRTADAKTCAGWVAGPESVANRSPQGTMRSSATARAPPRGPGPPGGDTPWTAAVRIERLSRQPTSNARTGTAAGAGAFAQFGQPFAMLGLLCATAPVRAASTMRAVRRSKSEPCQRTATRAVLLRACEQCKLPCTKRVGERAR